MNFGLILIIPIILIVMVLFLYLLKIFFKKGKSTDVILFGIEITILGGIFIFAEINFVGSEVVNTLLIIIGLTLSLIGVLKSMK